MSTTENGGTIPDTPGGRLKQARIERGYDKQAAFVRKFNLTQSTYALHESGKRNFDNDTAQIYAEALDLPVEFLLFGSQPMDAQEHSPDPESWLIPELEINAGHWISTDIPQTVHVSTHHRVPADPRYPADIQQAYLMSGGSGGAGIPTGSIVVALNVCDNPATLPKGSLVIIKRFHDRGRNVEVSLRKIKNVQNGEITLSIPFPDTRLDSEALADIVVPVNSPPKTIQLVGRVIAHHSYY